MLQHAPTISNRRADISDPRFVLVDKQGCQAGETNGEAVLFNYNFEGLVLEGVDNQSDF
jgi:hypothetical protein